MFKGIITPIVTPFNRDDNQTINYKATEQLVDHLIAKGINGIFVLGTNGEFHVLTTKEKIDFIKYVTSYVDGRVDVFAGTGDCSLSESILLAIEAEKAGVDALSILPPYFIRPSVKEIVNYYHSISKATDLPIIVYNIPKNVGYNIDANLFVELCKIENIVGIKDSSGDNDLLKSFIEIADQYKKIVLVGSDSKISFGYKHGAVGAIAGTSNLITDTIVELFHFLEEADYEKAEMNQRKIEALRAELKKGTVPSILKRSIELAQIAEVGPARLPVLELDRDLDSDLEKMLEYYNLI